jgi:drug/metabolite transporter (DMT)-like permease
MRRLQMSAERRRRLVPLAMLTVVVMIWSSNNIATKLVLHEMSTGLLTLVRFTLTTLLFHLPAFLLIRRFGAPVSQAVWVRLGFAAVIG